MLDLLIDRMRDEVAGASSRLEDHGTAGAVLRRQYVTRGDQGAGAESCTRADLADGRKPGLDLPALDRLFVTAKLGCRRGATAGGERQGGRKPTTQMSTAFAGLVVEVPHCL